MDSRTVWTRLSNWFKPYSLDEDRPYLATIDPQYDYDNGPLNGNGTPAGVKKPAASSRFGPWKKRDEIIGQMQLGYDKLLDLVDAIREQLDSQQQRSDKMTESVLDLAQGMSALPDAARNQTDRLAGLTGQLETSNRHIHSICEIMRDWPQTTLAQKQAMESIARQLESSTQATDRLTRGLESVSQTVKMLTEASSQQVETLQMIQASSRRQEHRLAHSLNTQARRFTALLALMLVFVLASSVAIAATLWS